MRHPLWSKTGRLQEARIDRGQDARPQCASKCRGHPGAGRQAFISSKKIAAATSQGVAARASTLRLKPTVCSDIAGPLAWREARPMRLEEPLKARAGGRLAPLRALYQTQNDQQDHCTDEGIDDFTNETRSNRKPNHRQ